MNKPPTVFLRETARSIISKIKHKYFYQALEVQHRNAITKSVYKHCFALLDVLVLFFANLDLFQICM